MGDETFEYLKLQYEEGARTIRYWIECRYKILQFVGYFNGAVLTIGFSQGVLLSTENPSAGIAICFLSILVSLMGLATEMSTTPYVSAYFEVLRAVEGIENKLAENDLKNLRESLDSARASSGLPLGIFTHGKDVIERERFHKILSVHKAHKWFYRLLMGFWVFLLICQARLLPLWRY